MQAILYTGLAGPMGHQDCAVEDAHAEGERSSPAELTWGAGRRAQLKICICFLVTCLALCVLANSVQSLSCVQLFSTPWTGARQASLSITNSRSLPSFMSIEAVMPSNHLILCRPLLLPPSIFAGIRVFSSESVLHIRWPKDWSFSLNISPSIEYSGLISFRMD